jgi:hypothetical protein
MKSWWVRAGYWLADGSTVMHDTTVTASSMEAAMAAGVREGRKAAVPPRKKVTEIRARVEPVERKEV